MSFPSVQDSSPGRLRGMDSAGRPQSPCRLPGSTLPYGQYGFLLLDHFELTSEFERDPAESD
jgi:hypothetical protein